MLKNFKKNARILMSAILIAIISSSATHTTYAEIKDVKIYDENGNMTEQGDEITKLLGNYAKTFSFTGYVAPYWPDNIKYNQPNGYGIYAHDCASFTSRAWNFAGVSMCKDWHFIGTEMIGDGNNNGRVSPHWRSSRRITEGNPNLVFEDVAHTLMGGTVTVGGLHFTKNIDALNKNLNAGDIITVDYVDGVYPGYDSLTDHTMVCVGRNANNEPVFSASNSDEQRTISEILHYKHHDEFDGIANGVRVFRPRSYKVDTEAISKNSKKDLGYGINGQMAYVWYTGASRFNEAAYKQIPDYDKNASVYSPIVAPHWQDKNGVPLYSLDYDKQFPAYLSNYTSNSTISSNKIAQIIENGFVNCDETMESFNGRMESLFGQNFAIQCGYEAYSATQIAIWLTQGVTNIDCINDKIADKVACSQFEQRNIDLTACSRVWNLANAFYKNIQPINVDNNANISQKDDKYMNIDDYIISPEYSIEMANPNSNIEVTASNGCVIITDLQDINSGKNVQKVYPRQKFYLAKKIIGVDNATNDMNFTAKINLQSPEQNGVVNVLFDKTTPSTRLAYISPNDNRNTLNLDKNSKFNVLYGQVDYDETVDGVLNFDIYSDENCQTLVSTISPDKNKRLFFTNFKPEKKLFMKLNNDKFDDLGVIPIEIGNNKINRINNGQPIKLTTKVVAPIQSQSPSSDNSPIISSDVSSENIVSSDEPTSSEPSKTQNSSLWLVVFVPLAIIAFAIFIFTKKKNIHKK